jgi:hypothetical protein
VLSCVFRPFPCELLPGLELKFVDVLVLEVEVEGIANGLIPVTPTPAPTPSFIPVPDPDAAREDVNVDEEAELEMDVEVGSSPHLSDELLFSFFNSLEPEPEFEFEVVIVGILREEWVVDAIDVGDDGGSEGRLGWEEGPSG